MMFSLKQYDTDDSGTWSYVEIYSMLDSLGATLTRKTIDSFFTRFGKSPEGALTAEEAIICLEDELTKPRSEKREIDLPPSDLTETKSGTTTPLSEMTGLALADNALAGPLRFTGEALTGEPAQGVPYKEGVLEDTMKHVGHTAPGTNTPSSSASGQTKSFTPLSETGSASPADAPFSGNHSDSPEAHELERVINIQTCPLCHKKLSKKAEVDMVSHVAVCASQDWSSLDSLTVANFVSTSQAQRKWLTKLVTKVSHGTYKLGAVSLILKTLCRLAC
jgi:phosphatidylserine decarboxylase